MSRLSRLFAVFRQRSSSNLHLLLQARTIEPTEAPFCEAQSRSVMLQHQDQTLNYGGRGGSNSSSPSHVQNRKLDKDGNFNFLSGSSENGYSMTGGDENRNQARPRNQGPMGRDPPNCSPSSGYHGNSSLLSPRSRMPCWTQLEPLPEIETGDDGFGRVPPDGAEERRMEGEEGQMMMYLKEEKQRGKILKQREKSSFGFKGDEDDDEWGDSDSGSEYSVRSGGSMSSLNLESGGEGMLGECWDRVGVGEPRSSSQEGGHVQHSNREYRYLNRKSASNLEELEEGMNKRDDDQSSDSDDDMPELMDAVWTLRDRERFKAQEMEKHQVQLTMYRRLALIRWVRTLQSRVEEQQNRLQSTFDVILTHRKELLRMGAAVNNTTPAPAPAVAQS
ncbi:UPF0500 protein C1orf216 homolog isoform X1 [Synchiropus splendidus]|uniref:UPF0500 protein C1orf216 homolog isoform X1 n=1 Tax=Synchiropus splendidus TaxID=270530 RepID=UPI00237E8059|nr:UPF0500 protein C1orf216 homolog isoform X1 [Synchiropus splendidus]